MAETPQRATAAPVHTILIPRELSTQREHSKSQWLVSLSLLGTFPWAIVLEIKSKQTARGTPLLPPGPDSPEQVSPVSTERDCCPRNTAVPTPWAGCHRPPHKVGACGSGTALDLASGFRFHAPALPGSTWHKPRHLCAERLPPARTGRPLTRLRRMHRKSFRCVAGKVAHAVLTLPTAGGMATLLFPGRSEAGTPTRRPQCPAGLQGNPAA